MEIEERIKAVSGGRNLYCQADGDGLSNEPRWWSAAEPL